MDMNTLYKNLTPPKGVVDCVLDTDTYNEIDDQFALAYMLKCPEKMNVKAIYAAPFFNNRSSSPCDGMQRSYDEILKVLHFMHREDMIPNVFKGSENYLPDEKTPVISDAAKHLASLAMGYTPEKPLYVVAIGAITNVASALILNPEISDRIVVVWLGGHSFEKENTGEFNMVQDIAAARVVWNMAEFLVQLPCAGVVEHFSISAPELREYLLGKGDLCTYLAQNTLDYMERFSDRCWTKPIWDLTAPAWLMNENSKYMDQRIIYRRLPNYDKQYNYSEGHKLMAYIEAIHRDNLMTDMVAKLTN
ncbi:MAG: nucleoside hydrolase [Ruminococcaceae bacterium]|nr:nucleoside hydrolase [Oscillospiraceae bacterium]